ncbi:hypothetical protein B0H14DRAFT_3162709 [Mycena olivaceomarginata]|nr:hypothetical protein B0H14DRAFT_3162709 [Mycena olivaceomarginata]
MPSLFSLVFFFLLTLTNILVVRVPMAPGELERLVNRLPHAVLFRFQDEARKAPSFPKSFRIKNPQLFAGNEWIDLDDDLKAWLWQQDDLQHFLNEPSILDSDLLVDLAGGAVSGVCKPQRWRMGLMDARESAPCVLGPDMFLKCEDCFVLKPTQTAPESSFVLSGYNLYQYI